MNLNSSQIIQQQAKISYQQQQATDEFINKLQPIQNTTQQFQALVIKWKQYSQQRASKVQQWQQIVMAKEKDTKNYKKNSVCLVCYERLTEKKNWCRVCGMECCEKCVARFRVMPKNNTLQTTIQQNTHESQNAPVATCLKCDKLYIEAFSQLEFQKQLQLKIRALEKIQKIGEKEKEQEQQKIKPASEKLIKKQNSFKLALTATQITQMNQNVKLQTLQMKKKITWGQDIKRKLATKYNKLRRQLSRSFNSSVNYQESQMIISPPKAYDSQATRSEADLLNESIANSVIEDDTKMIIGKGKCCTPCRIM